MKTVCTKAENRIEYNKNEQNNKEMDVDALRYGRECHTKKNKHYEWYKETITRKRLIFH